MSLPRPVRLVLLLAFGLALAAAWGCSKSEEAIPPPPDMPVEDVDDIAQQIGAMTASDNGGWFFTVQTLAESLAVPIPAAGHLRANKTRYRMLSQFTRTQGGITHNWRLGYFDNDLIEHAGRDSFVEFIEAGVTADGAPARDLAANQLSGATYGLFADSAQYSVDFIEPESDTVQFDVFMEDSSFALVTSAFRANSQRLWYQTNLISTTDNLLLRADDLPSPYPIGGQLELTIDARVMGPSGSREDFATEWLAEGRLDFDGTDTATLTITVGFGLGSPERQYRVNLKTGVVTKL